MGENYNIESRNKKYQNILTKQISWMEPSLQYSHDMKKLK